MSIVGKYCIRYMYFLTTEVLIYGTDDVYRERLFREII